MQVQDNRGTLNNGCSVQLQQNLVPISLLTRVMPQSTILVGKLTAQHRQLVAGTCEIVTLDRDSSQPRRTIARQTARCACRKGQIAGTTRASPACVEAHIVRSRQWCEMMPCLDDEGCDLLVNRTGWTCAQPGGRVKTTTRRACGGMLLSARLQASFNITNSLHYTRRLSATAAVPHNITPRPKTTLSVYEGLKENDVGFIEAFNMILTTCINHFLWLYVTKCGPSYLNLKLKYAKILSCVSF
ncbi:hypothetical protein PO909_021504 [Leuciscus waleckii]